MKPPPPRIVTRRPAPAKRTYEREPRPPFQIAADRPVAPYVQHTNVFRDAPWGTPCCLSKCRTEARYVVTFHQTGGSAAYCDDHAWPFRPRREVRQRGLAAFATATWETP